MYNFSIKSKCTYNCLPLHCGACCRQAPRKVGGRMDPEADMKGAAPKPSVCRRLFPEDEPDGMMDNMFNKITEEINRKLDEACNKVNTVWIIDG